MPVVSVRNVRVVVHEGQVPVGVAMRLAEGIASRVGVLVVLVMLMYVLVFELAVVVCVCVPLS